MITTISILLFILSGAFKWLRDRINNREFTQVTLPNTPKYQNGTGKKWLGIYSDWWHRADFLHISLLLVGMAVAPFHPFLNAAMGLTVTLGAFTILWNSPLLILKQKK